jgi:D-alanyl-lipoteichoic acid acyltransferase DltB (MBOAT superfamily)
MSFSSWIYFLFLPAVFGVVFSLPQRWRSYFLLIASYAFYMYWKAGYALVILSLTVIDYFAAMLMEKFKAPKYRRGIWLLSVCSNLGVLFVFKYMGFFAHELKWSMPELALPIGLSFHTLQAIGYTTDVYRGVFKAEKNFLRFALFIAWFPQMVAGPIERGSTLLTQLHGIRFPGRDLIREGLGLILWGVVKKVVIADNLALFVDAVYREPNQFSAPALLAAVYFFALQIYCDFSGYTDIARGSSLLFSVRLTSNFDRPFSSASLVEFWKRWHISLSSWFFEYVYYPLMRRFPSGAGPWLAALVVFLLSGLWHGANWTYLFWGLIHGAAFCLTLIFRPRRKVWGTFVTFNIVSFFWVFFRAPTMEQAWKMLSRMADIFTSTAGTHFDWSIVGKFNFIVIVGLGLLILLAEEHWAKDERFVSWVWRKAPWIGTGLILVTLTLGAFSGERFIYFQF